MDEATFLTTLIRVIGALQRADVPFALAGGAAVYARGGPHSQHDIDLLVQPSDAERAAQALTHAGMARFEHTCTVRLSTSTATVGTQRSHRRRHHQFRGSALGQRRRPQRSGDQSPQQRFAGRSR